MTSVLRVLLAGLLLAVAAPALAQGPWPQKPVRIVVPFPPGGSNDTLCRIVAEKLSAAWNQPVVIDNKAGAGGNVGAEIVFRADADGYTLLCSAPGPLSINHNLYTSLPYDWAKFVPITVLAQVPNVISARNELPANTAAELIAWGKANPGKLQYASQGNGSTSHLAAEMLASMAGFTLQHVPYRGEGPALVDLVAGRVDLYLGNIAGALRFHQSKQVKFLAVTGKTRSAVAPDVPSAVDIGLPDLVATAWFALAAPPGTPDAAIQITNKAVAAALALPDVREKFLLQGAEPVGRSSADTATFFKEEEARWRAVIRSANVKLE